MNATKQLDDAKITIRNLRVKLADTETKLDTAQKQRAHEAAKVAELRQQIEDLKVALQRLLAWTDGQEHLHGLAESGKQKYRADVQRAKEVLK